MLFILFVVLGRGAIEADLNWTIFAITVVLQTLVDLLLIEISILQTNALNSREARKIQPYINAGGTFGGMIAGLIAALFSDTLGTDNL